MKKVIKNRIDTCLKDQKPNSNYEVLKFHPPLPPESPPLIMMPFIKTLKDEMVYEIDDLPSSIEELPPTDFTQEPNSIEEIDICKNYLRNECTRPMCKYRHEFDLSKLPGIYIFCKDFQNNKCSHNPCKYVHATIFEEERFLETGYLPPEALAHQTRNELPYSANTNGTSPTATSISNMNLMPDPTVHLRACPAPTITTNNSFSPIRYNPDSETVFTNGTSNMGWPWKKLEEFKASQRGQGAKRVYKCDHCMQLENRLQFSKVTIENMTESSIDYISKIETVEEKQNRILIYVLNFLHSVKSASSSAGQFNQFGLNP